MLMVKWCRVIVETERDWRRVCTTPTTVLATSGSRAGGPWLVFLLVVMMLMLMSMILMTIAMTMMFHLPSCSSWTRTTDSTSEPATTSVEMPPTSPSVSTSCPLIRWYINTSSSSLSNDYHQFAIERKASSFLKFEWYMDSTNVAQITLRMYYHVGSLPQMSG